MRAAIFCDYPYRRRGEEITAEQPVALFLAAVAERLDDVTFLGRLDPVPGAYPYPLPPGAGFVALPHYARLSPRSATVFAAALRRYWRVLADVDVVWLLGPHPLGVLFAAAALLRRRRVVLGVRQHLPDYFRRRHPGSRSAAAIGQALEGVWRLLARRCPVVAVGPDLARGYSHAPALLASTVSLVRSQDVLERPEPSWDGELVALSVGRLDPEKNPLLLADVVARLPKRWRLVVCGDGSLEADLAERAARLGVGDRIDLRGHVPAGGPLRAAYAESHAFLHVSWTEGFPQVLLEAWAAGLPVVATAVGGVSEVAGDGALLIGPGDAAAAADGLQTLAADPDRRAALVAEGRARVRERTLESEAERVARFVEAAA